MTSSCTIYYYIYYQERRKAKGAATHPTGVSKSCTNLFEISVILISKSDSFFLSSANFEWIVIVRKCYMNKKGNRNPKVEWSASWLEIKYLWFWRLHGKRGSKQYFDYSSPKFVRPIICFERRIAWIDIISGFAIVKYVTYIHEDDTVK